MPSFLPQITNFYWASLILILGFLVFLIAQLIKNPPACRRHQFYFWVEKIRWRRDRLPTPVFLGFPYSSAGKESACNAGDLGQISGLGKICLRRERLPTPLFQPGEFHGLNRVHGVAKSQTRLSNFHYHQFLIQNALIDSNGNTVHFSCFLCLFFPEYYNILMTFHQFHVF